MNVRERFWAKVEQDGDCWVWTANKTQNGYGLFYPVGNRPVVAHRFAYEDMAADIPKGLQLDHLCRNRACVNPAHLDPVTPLENSRRGRKGVLHTVCAQGHAMDETNTLHYETKRGSSRVCRTCKNARNRARRLRGAA